MINASIIGASGYTGSELLRILLSHKEVRVSRLFSGLSAGRKLDEVYPFFTGQLDRTMESFEPAAIAGTDVVFVALPGGEAMKIIPQLLPVVKHVIDLGGDFRLSSPSLYEQYYLHTHEAPQLLGQATYGLPELNKNAIASARFIANPGCYPTSAILGLLPVLKQRIGSPESVVINSLSGSSGAGRTTSFDLSFSEINENVRAYKIGAHKHIPEIQSVLEQAVGQKVSLSFIPHLVPLTRGIYSTIHVNLQQSMTDASIQELYREFYRNEPFVRIRSHVPQLRDVVHTNFCDIHCRVAPETNQLIIISVIDNLVKGAAGQAIQNMNIMYNLPETEGLLSIKEHQYVH